MRWKAAAVDRRTLLVGGGVGLGLIIAWAAWPRRGGSPLRAAKGEQVFGPYLRIADDGRVTVAVAQAETGQGAWTGLAQIAADELGAAWDSVAVEPAPLAAGYENQLLGELTGLTTRLTAQSSSVRTLQAPLREAAAVARALLCAAAAARWGIDPSECTAAAGFVTAGTRRLGFGDIAAEAAAHPPPANAPLRRGPANRLIGQSLPRLDLPSKSDGSLRFAGDVRLPDIRFAAVRIAPPGGRVTDYDRAAVESRAGVRLIARDSWIAAIAETGWAAEQALSLAAPRFTGPAAADTPAIEEALVKALDGKMKIFAERGDYEEEAEGRRALAATYTIAPAPHLGLEPPAATVRFTGDRLELWVGTQAPDLARAAAARDAGIDPALVTLYPMPVGDGGGRAVESEVAAIAIAIAREINAPVSLTLSANTAQNHDRLRPPLAARLSALPDPTGGLATWNARFAGAAGLDAALARASGEGAPDFVPRGGVPPYASAALRVESATAELPIRCGYLRGDVEALTAFANECFVDELARARGVEPLAFRVGLLGGNARLARALTTAAVRGGWDGGQRGSALGIAGASAFGSHIGLLAEASIGDGQRVKVTRLVAAVDAGRLVNPRLVRQQIEGGLLHALASATGAAPEIIAGMPRARPLGALSLATVKDLPRIEVELIASGQPAGGVSGLGSLVLAAAVANAIFAATGLRLRRLPFDPMSPA
jgi:isoquinoline 1-oxidoreductase beta subunit